jgi:hypothetical protein
MVYPVAGSQMLVSTMPTKLFYATFMVDLIEAQINLGPQKTVYLYK